MPKERSSLISRSPTAKKVFWISFAAVALIFLVHLMRPTRHAMVPDELIGEWHSTDPKYADRSLEIDAVSINFGTGEGTVATGFVKDVKAVSEGTRTVFTITYSVENVPSEVTVYYEGPRTNVLRFKNQEKIAWTKD